MLLTIVLSSTDIAGTKEEEMYPFDLFVAEFGGAMGLLLGFSFIRVWDVTK